LVVGWWWGVNFQNIYQYLTGLAGQGEAATDPMNLLAWQTWIHYFRLFFLQQVGPIVAIVFLVIGKKENKKLIWWAIVTYVIFTVIKNKDFRFTLPLLTVVAVWMGWGLAELKRKWLVWLVVLWMGFNYVENSYNFPLKKPVVVSTPTFLMGDINWIDFSDYPVREARQQIWPGEEIVKNMLSISDKQRVLVLVDVAELNDNNLKMYSEMMNGGNKIEIHSIYEPNFKDWKNFDLVIVGDKSLEPAPFYATNLDYLKQSRDWLWNNLENFEKLKEYNFQNQQKLYLMRVI
jgi:hypothetical protein